jgi:hypothetical protein
LKNQNYQELVSALIDNEISDSYEIDEIKSLINENNYLSNEYFILSSTKKLLQSPICKISTPNSVRQNIILSLSKNQKKKIFEEFVEFLSFRPSFAFTSFLLISISLYLFAFNFQTQDLGNEQSGNRNMYRQAEANFSKLLQGTLAPQIISSDADSIKSFFKLRGVEYETKVPTFTDWNLLGAVVSEDEGEKFAHHVYSNYDKTKIIYVFQVGIEYITKHSILDLSENMLNSLKRGVVYTENKSGIVTLIKKSSDSIFAIVSNEELKKIESNFHQL